MGRTAAQIRHDEVTRLVKPLLALGLKVSRIDWDGERVSVHVGDSGENENSEFDTKGKSEPLRRCTTL